MERKDEKSKIIIILLLLILLFIPLLLYWRKQMENHRDAINPVGSLRGGVELSVDPNEKSGLSSENSRIEEQGVVISGRGAMTIPADAQEVTVDFHNPEENENLYYLTFELRLFDGESKDYEVLYTSGLVEPGKHIDKITLSRGLEKGVYQAVVHVQPYRMDEEKTLTNNADMNIALIVQ